MMELLAKLVQKPDGKASTLGLAEMPLDPRLADLIAKFFPMPVFVLNKQKDRIEWASPGGMLFLGIDGQRLQKTGARAFLEGYFLPAETLTRLYTQGAREGMFESRVRTPQGERLVQGFWMGLPNEKGECCQFVVGFQDVTEIQAMKQELLQYSEELQQQVDQVEQALAEKQKLVEELREKSEQLRLLAAASAYSANMKFILDREGRVVWVNRTFERASGWEAKELVGKHVSEIGGSFAHLLRGPDDTPGPDTLITAHFVRAPFTEEIYARDREGRGFWMLLTLAPIHDAAGEVTHYVGALLNVHKQREQKRLLEEKQAELEASLRYARRIQEKFLSGAEKLKEYFSEVGVLYLPQGQVGGDFYQAFPVEGGVLVGVGDGTGHGVPAALLTIYAMTLLRRGVREQGVNLEAIYRFLMDDLAEVFGGPEGLSEGFELALLYYEPTTRRATYLGVGRPLWVLRSGEIYPVSGSRGDLSVTGADWREESPTPQSLTLLPGDRLYLFSDGVTDQLNPEGKRFSSSRLKSFLQTNSYLPVEEQVSLLRQALAHWAMGTPQTDDMLLLAMQV